MASICSDISFPPKLMVSSVSAMTPAIGPNPRIATSSMPQISTGTERASTSIPRPSG